MMGIVLCVFSLAVWIWRGALLSTRLNRRITGLVGISGVFTLAQRVVGAVMGLEVREVIMQNCTLMIALCVAGGVTLHWGFFWSAASFTLGLVLAWLLPGYEPQMFSLSAVAALISAAISWRSWRSELSMKKE